MISGMELIVVAILLSAFFFFGKDRVKEWIKVGHEAKAEMDSMKK